MVDFAARKQKRNERCTFPFLFNIYSLLLTLSSLSSYPFQLDLLSFIYFFLSLFILFSPPSILSSRTRFLLYPSQLPLPLFFSSRPSILHLLPFICPHYVLRPLSLSPVSASSLISPRYLRLFFSPSLLSRLLFIFASPFLLLLCSFFRLSLFPFSFSVFYTFSFRYLSFKTTGRATLHHFPIASLTRSTCSSLIFFTFFSICFLCDSQKLAIRTYLLTSTLRRMRAEMICCVRGWGWGWGLVILGHHGP